MKTLSYKSANTQSGNMLIYILGAIFLLGILVTLVKGSSTPGSNIDRETLEIKVAEVQQYGNELERAVAYVLRSGYSESDIRFAHPNHSSAYGDITDTPGRQIFDRAGGGATWKDNDSDIQDIDTDWVFQFGPRFFGPVGSIGTLSNFELTAFLPNVTRNFCLLLNEKTGVENPGGEPPDIETALIFTPVFAGTITNTSNVFDADLTAPPKLEACVEGSDTPPPSGTYHYYRVLLAR